MRIKGQKILFIVILLLIVVYFLVTSVFISKREQLAEVAGVRVNVVNPVPLFIKEKDITAIFVKHGDKWQSPDSIKEQKLEREIRKNKYVEDVQIYATADKHYVVEVVQRKPILRVETAKESFFLDKNGVELPTGNRYASHVHLYRGDITKEFAKKKLLTFQRFLEQHQFWKEMVDYVSVEEDELILYLRLKSGKIRFGDVENMETKFEKLQLFIDKIGKYKGLETYGAIDLRFANQIVCVKK